MGEPVTPDGRDSFASVNLKQKHAGKISELKGLNGRIDRRLLLINGHGV